MKIDPDAWYTYKQAAEHHQIHPVTAVKWYGPIAVKIGANTSRIKGSGILARESEGRRVVVEA
jgi:hypothetical protein